jgi:hypothetical protein
MMTLADLITSRLHELGWQKKKLAHEWQGAMGKEGSYDSRVSRLLHERPEEYESLRRDDDLVAALAKALQADVAIVRRALEVSLRRPTLVLHPSLQERARAFFLKRSRIAPHTFACVEPDGPAAPTCETLRDLARGKLNPIVVLPGEADRGFFKGAELATTLVEPTETGFRISAMPDLIAPLPPRLKDADGMPMLPDEGLERRYRSRMERINGSRAHIEDDELKWFDTIREADEEGRKVTFRADWLLRTSPSEQELRRWVLESVSAKLASARRSNRQPSLDGQLWLRGCEFVALRAAGTALTATIAAHHPVHDLVTFEPLVDALAAACARINPYRQGGSLEVDAALAAFAAETGLPLRIDIDMLRTVLVDARARGNFRSGASVQCSRDADVAFRAVLADVLGREFVLDCERAHVLFELQAALAAPLVHVEPDAGWDRSALANVGKGYLLRIDVAAFAGESPQPIQEWTRENEWVLDGGNVRLRLGYIRGQVTTLKGTCDPGLVRRRRRCCGSLRARPAASGVHGLGDLAFLPFLVGLRRRRDLPMRAAIEVRSSHDAGRG